MTDRAPMMDRDPPKLAVFLLRNFSSPKYRACFEGDLLEMYREGRTALWYWRQVIVALLLARAVWGAAVLRIVNALLLAAVIALGVGTFTQADTGGSAHGTYEH